MEYNNVVNSIFSYIKEHPENRKKPAYEIYNAWATTTGTIIKDPILLQWMMQYINDLRSVPQEILADAN